MEQTLPAYRVVPGPVELHVDASVAAVRPVIVAGILRGMTFNAQRYASFIELQEKLHANICRKRSLVSVGTHDLATVQGPFRYTALPAQGGFHFVPLGQTATVDGEGMMSLLAESHLKPYLPLIKGFPRYPVVQDAAGRVCSVPPVINSEHSKITLNTKDVLVEVTATDATKARIVLDTVLALFAEYAARPYEVEAVRIVQADGQAQRTPDWTPRTLPVPLAYLDSAIGVPLVHASVPAYLQRMGVRAEVQGAEVRVEVPPTRSDILHACDVMEDVAIGYGFNHVLHAATMPRTVTAGAQQPLNKLSDQLRQELAYAGYTEALTLSLCSEDENGPFLLHPEENARAVKLANPKTLEYQVARTTLYAGLLKTLQHNRQVPLPVKIFEVSDVVWLDPQADTGARNRRFLCALHCSATGGFEHLHGLLDRLFLALEQAKAYKLVACDDPMFLAGRCARIELKGQPIGLVGLLHPLVLAHFDLHFPVSALHLDVHAL